MIALNHVAKTFFLSAAVAFWGMNTYSQEAENLAQRLNDSIYLIKEIRINLNTETLEIPCKINMDSGLLEVILCTPKGKVHESLLVSRSSPVEFQTALLLLGLDPVNEVPDKKELIPDDSPYLNITTPGDSVKLFISWENSQGKFLKPVEDFIKTTGTEKGISDVSWLFLGASTHYTGHVLVDPETTIIATYHDPLALMELNNSTRYDDTLYYVNEKETPPVGTQVNLIIKKTNNQK